jgi:hypothetical protein
VWRLYESSDGILLFIIIIIIISGVGLSPLGTAATSGLLYKPQMIDEGDCGTIGGMKIGRGNRSTRRKPAPAPGSDGISGRYQRLLIAAPVKQGSSHHWKFSKVHINQICTQHSTFHMYTIKKNYAGSKQKSYKIMRMNVFIAEDKVKPDIENTRGLNLAVVKLMTIQVTELPL